MLIFWEIMLLPALKVLTNEKRGGLRLVVSFEEPSPSTYKTLVNIAATLFRSVFFYPCPGSSVVEPEPEVFASAEPELEP
jgi:hypothetical protein